MLGALIVLFAFNFNLSDGGSLTWNEPLPIQNIPDNAIVEHTNHTTLPQGTYASLTWRFSLSSDLTFDSLTIRFDKEAIAGIWSSGQGVVPSFEDKYGITWIPSQRITLGIFHVTTAQNGTFVCEVTAAKGHAIATWKSIIEVDVLDPPSNMIVISSVQVVSLYDELSLNCSADGRPKPTITWTRLSDNTIVTMPLNIGSRQYGGYYRCTADNGVGRALTKDVFINVLSPPIITIESKFFVGREQTASLYCDVEGNPTPWIHWTPCDLPSIGCHKQYLNISKVQTSRATYTCTASNYLGSDSETTLLVIGGTNIFISFSTSGECDEKDSVWGSLQNELVKVFANTQSYIGAEIIADIRCGSLIFDVVLKFNSQTAEDVIISTIKNAIVDGMLGELMVNASSIVGIPPVPVPTTTPPLKTTPKPDTEKCTCSCTVFVIGTVILAAINIGLTAYIIWLHRRGTGRQKR
ncbi:neurotrimin-like [Montipora foliosa]|uniref:neurotrimin-like n=1 Tax=Montipora foliosa TaxID=591990 RepID=UPI0035F15AA5